jgi:hypothetical protein
LLAKSNDDVVLIHVENDARLAPRAPLRAHERIAVGHRIFLESDQRLGAMAC